MLAKVWAYFDEAETHYGTAWPIQYRTPEPERRRHAATKLGVRAFAPLVYPHKPGMARWLTEWVTEFAARTPGAVPDGHALPRARRRRLPRRRASRPGPGW